MTKNKKRRHHYVWRRYLRAWSDNEKIFCLREKKILNPNLMGVAQQRDFYKLRELRDEDVSFIKKLAIENSPKGLVRGHEDLLHAFSLISQLKNISPNIAITDNQQVRNAVELYIHNLEEDLHSDAENIGDKYLGELLKGNTEFFNTELGFIEFIYFLNVQYLRTKKIKENVVKGFALNKPHINMLGCWNVLSHIFAVNAVHSFCLDRGNYKLVLIKNNSDLEFITGDQPVINIFSLSAPKNEALERLAFYYPISPKLAVLVIEKHYFEGKFELTYDEKSVRSHNKAIVSSSLEQVFSSNREILEELYVVSE